MNRFAKNLLGSALLLAAGCGSGSSTPGDAAQPGTGPWVPLKVGYRWSYQVTGIDGKVSVKLQGVTSEEAVGGAGDSQGKTAFKLVTGNRFNDPEGDVSYQGLVGSRYVRFRELSISGSTGVLKKEEYYAEPWKLRLDTSEANTAVGARWPESYTQFEVDTPKIPAADGGDTGMADAGAAGVAADAALVTTMANVTDVWSVEGVDQSVTVPAGTFKALVVKRLANSGLGSEKTFWFVRGVGKVKESGVGEQTEELLSYQFP